MGGRERRRQEREGGVGLELGMDDEMTEKMANELTGR